MGARIKNAVCLINLPSHLTNQGWKEAFKFRRILFPLLITDSGIGSTVGRTLTSDPCFLVLLP